MLAGDSLGELVVSATRAQGITPDAGSALIVAQKVVSKAEGRRVKLTDVDVTAEAQALADLTGKDPRLVWKVSQIYCKRLARRRSSGRVGERRARRRTEKRVA